MTTLIGFAGLLLPPTFVLGVGVGWLIRRNDERRSQPFEPCEIVDFQAHRERRGCA